MKITSIGLVIRMEAISVPILLHTYFIIHTVTYSFIHTHSYLQLYVSLNSNYSIELNTDMT